MIANNPLISICIPTFNRGNYLRKCIESIIGYPNDDIEIIVQDNNSPDDTEYIVKSYNDRRIIYHRNSTNVGAKINIRTILDRANGLYCYLLTDDDMLVPGAIQIIKAFIKENDPSVFRSDAIVYLEKSKQAYIYSAIKKTKPNKDLTLIEKADIILYSHILSGLCFKKSELDFKFYDQNIEVWYPSLMIVGILSQNMGYLSAPLTIHTWENQTYWGIDTKNTELTESETHVIMLLQAKIDLKLFNVLLIRYILSTGIFNKQMKKYLSNADIFNIRKNLLIKKSKRFISSFQKVVRFKK